jgi:hypothetical protein
MKKLNFLFACFLAFSICLGMTSKIYAQEELMTNDQVVSLVNAGLNSTIIVNKIRTSKSNFDTSTDTLIKLKKAGISDEIINTMLEAKGGFTSNAMSENPVKTKAADPNDPKSPHSFGIYLFEEKNGVRKMMQLEPNVSAQNRTDGLLAAKFTPFGLGKVKIKANLPGVAANLQLNEARPIFYFYLDAKSGGLNISSGIPSSTNEFALVRFKLRKDDREITLSRANSYAVKGGLLDEFVVPFTSENLGNGVFRVTPTADLKNGEYAFLIINSGESNTGTAVGAKFFDFGVKLTP